MREMCARVDMCHLCLLLFQTSDKKDAVSGASRLSRPANRDFVFRNFQNGGLTSGR